MTQRTELGFMGYTGNEMTRDYRGRLLQTHGSHDELVPQSMAQELYAAATCPKEIAIIPNGKHNSPQSEQCYALVELLITQIYD